MLGFATKLVKTVAFFMATTSLVIATTSIVGADGSKEGVVSGIVLFKDMAVSDALVQIFETVPEDRELADPGGLEHRQVLPGISISPTVAEERVTTAARRPLLLTTTGSDGRWRFEGLVPGREYLVTTQLLGRDGAELLAEAQILTAYSLTSARGHKRDSATSVRDF